MKHKYKKIIDFKPVPSSVALVRVSLDLPTDKNGKIISIVRLLNIIPTIEYLQLNNTKIILIGHCTNKHMSLNPVSKLLQKYIKHTFVPSVRGHSIKEHIQCMNDGEVLMLENLRIDAGEKTNNEEFAQLLASYADFFVFEDFPVAHRSHASVIGIPKYIPSYIGIYFNDTIVKLENIKHYNNAIGIFGGGKADTKIKIIEKLLDKFEEIYLGGVIANSFLKQQGFNIGRSIHTNTEIPIKFKNNIKIILPEDFLVERRNRTLTLTKDKITEKDFIVDIGPNSIIKIEKAIKNAKHVIVNGPVGLYDNGYAIGSHAVAKAIFNTNAKVLLGGGDILASTNTYSFAENITALDGGGAFMYYLQHNNLPAIEALSEM